MFCNPALYTDVAKENNSFLRAAAPEQEQMQCEARKDRAGSYPSVCEVPGTPISKPSPHSFTNLNFNLPTLNPPLGEFFSSIHV